MRKLHFQKRKKRRSRNNIPGRIQAQFGFESRVTQDFPVFRLASRCTNHCFILKQNFSSVSVANFLGNSLGMFNQLFLSNEAKIRKLSSCCKYLQVELNITFIYSCKCLKRRLGVNPMKRKLRGIIFHGYYE